LTAALGALILGTALAVITTPAAANAAAPPGPCTGEANKSNPEPACPDTGAIAQLTAVKQQQVQEQLQASGALAVTTSKNLAEPYYQPYGNWRCGPAKGSSSHDVVTSIGGHGYVF
jgi:hypothetical protein